MKSSISKIFFNFPKIAVIFIIIILTVILNFGISYYLINRERDNIEQISDVINPYLDNLDDLSDVLMESRMYVTNWVYLPYDVRDKKNLSIIQKYRYQKAKIKISQFIKILKRKNHSIDLNPDSLAPLFFEFDDLVKSQKKIMTLLVNFDDYENPSKKFEAEDIIENEVIPKTESLVKKLNLIIIQNKILASSLKSELNQDTQLIYKLIISFSLLTLIFIVLSIRFISININRPVLKMKKIINQLAKGELVDYNIIAEKNIIGEMAVEVNRLSKSFTKTSEFANEIGKGNLHAQYQKLSNNDMLGNALLNMRDSLISYSYDMETQVKIRTEEVLEKSRKIEEQKLFFESIFNNIPIDIIIFNEHHEYIFVNNIAIKDPTVRDYMIGKTDFDYCELKKIETESARNRFEIFEAVKISREDFEFEETYLTKNNIRKWRLRKFYPVYDEQEFKFMIGYGLDITTKKEHELSIQESLEEKEALLGEIHHRVKNNLTLVLGLVEMQREYVTDERIKGQFSEIRNRIAAMSLIHDKMYRGASFAKIDLQEYLTDLIISIAKFYKKDKDVKLNFDIEQIFVTSKNAVPLALLVNEIITNAFKYAFENKTNGQLQISLKEIEENYILRIHDNGNGLPEHFEASQSQSLGFKLLQIFSKQLKGHLDFHNDNGLVFIIKWKGDRA